MKIVGLRVLTREDFLHTLAGRNVKMALQLSILISVFSFRVINENQYYIILLLLSSFIFSMFIVIQNCKPAIQFCTFTPIKKLNILISFRVVVILLTFPAFSFPTKLFRALTKHAL